MYERMTRLESEPTMAAVIAIFAGVAVFVLSATVLEYHTTNHDEGVYLLQSAMLLDGQFELYTGELTGAFRPWFFIEDGGRLYPKYSPVVAAMYAVSMGIFGEPRVTLALIATGNTALVYLLGNTTFDRRVGVVAAVTFAASPLAIVTTSAFLAYAPTTFLNLLFAVFYLRSHRNESSIAAGIAGVSIGLAFFARPFTAVLFATPFMLHALYGVVSSMQERSSKFPGPVVRRGITALFGLALVGVTLAYNARMTGSPLLFPYEAFAPLDGPGFGRRQILDHSIEYTPEVALRANGYVLWYFATRWFTAGPIGTALAIGGLGWAASRWYRAESAIDATQDGMAFERTAGLSLAGLFITVPAGNVLFWGNYNILATLSDPTDGLVSQFGPFYHFDLLVPLSIFAAVGIVASSRAIPPVRTGLRERYSARVAKGLLVGSFVVCAVLVVLVNSAVVSAPLERNAANTDKYENAYEPIVEASFDDALVFIPTPYGDWQNHPFQYLRNDPGFDGPVVYALDRGPEDDFAVVDEYPNRTVYRYAYQGEWTPSAYQHVTPKLELLEVERGSRVEVETIVAVPERVQRARVRLENENGSAVQYSIDDPRESLSVGWSMDRDVARLEELEANSSVTLGDADTITLLVTLVQPDGSTLTYRGEATVRKDSDAVEVIWPPERYVCLLVTNCGAEGTYIPGDSDAHREGISFETRVEAIMRTE